MTPDENAGLDALVEEISAERPEIDPEFATRLDAWAAAGFPRGERPGSSRATNHDAAGRARVFLGALTPRRLAPVGAAATLFVVAVVAITRFDEFAGTRPVPPGDVATIQGDDPVTPVEPVAPVDEAPGSLPFLRESADEASGALAGPAGRRTGGGPAAGQDVRRIERDAQMTLAAPVDEVQAATNDAIAVVERNDGIVLDSRSSITNEQARATLQLSIPTRNLDQALDELAGLADVTRLSEGALDITRPFVDARDRERGLRAERRSVLDQIEAATTQEELDQLRERLDRLDRQVARADAQFDRIQRHARRSTVALEVTSEGASKGDWSIDEALDDAGRVLTVAAGVILISGAVLLPLALVAAIAYLVLSRARHRARERALDESGSG